VDIAQFKTTGSCFINLHSL